MHSSQHNGTSPNQPPVLSRQASEMLKSLGGDPDDYQPAATKTPADCGAGTTGTTTPDHGGSTVDGDHVELDEEAPSWLESFLAGETDIEVLADQMAGAIRQDPRFTQKPWWPRFCHRLAASVPDQLVSMAKHLVALRNRLEGMPSHKGDR